MDIPKYGDIAKSRRDAANPNLWDGLRLALFPALGRSGRTLVDWSGYCNPIVHSGTWARANQYTAINDPAAFGQVSTGRRLLPITGAPGRVSIFAWVRRTNAGGEASILRQFVTAETNRTNLAIGANVRFQNVSDYNSTATVAVGDVVTIAVSVNPNVSGDMFINGRFDTAVSTMGMASDANFELDGATRDCDLLGLCVWNGKALTRSEIVALHADPFRVIRRKSYDWVGDFAATVGNTRNRSSRFLCFPG